MFGRFIYNVLGLGVVVSLINDFDWRLCLVLENNGGLFLLYFDNNNVCVIYIFLFVCVFFVYIYVYIGIFIIRVDRLLNNVIFGIFKFFWY